MESYDRPHSEETCHIIDETKLQIYEAHSENRIHSHAKTVNRRSTASVRISLNAFNMQH